MRLNLLAVTVAAALIAGCGGSPAAPAEHNDPVGALSISCRVEGGGWRCSLAVEIAPGQIRDVTGLATWSTSDPTIAIVNSVGLITVLRPGEFAIRAAYGGDEIAMIIPV